MGSMVGTFLKVTWSMPFIHFLDLSERESMDDIRLLNFFLIIITLLVIIRILMTYKIVVIGMKLLVDTLPFLLIIFLGFN
jgi:hypothetical protein